MGVKMVEDLPFKTGFYNLIGQVIPRCCTECETAKFHYASHCVGMMFSLNCKTWDRCPLRNKETEQEETDG